MSSLILSLCLRNEDLVWVQCQSVYIVYRNQQVATSYAFKVFWWSYMDECNIEISEDSPQHPRTGLNQPGMQEDQSWSLLKCLIWNRQNVSFLTWLRSPLWRERSLFCVTLRPHFSWLKSPSTNSKEIYCVLELKDSEDKWNSTPWRIRMKRKMNTSNFKNEWWQLELESFGSESVNRKCGSSAWSKFELKLSPYKERSQSYLHQNRKSQPLERNDDYVPVKEHFKIWVLLELKCIIIRGHNTNSCLNQSIKEGQTSFGTSMIYTLYCPPRQKSANPSALALGRHHPLSM